MQRIKISIGEAKGASVLYSGHVLLEILLTKTINKWLKEMFSKIYFSINNNPISYDNKSF